MNSRAIDNLRQKLGAGATTYGMWVTLESASITEMGVALGLDWIVIDGEHGHLDWQDIVQHLRAAVRSDTVMLVRVAELNAGLIKRVLDIGADGVIIPWVETAEQLQQAVAYCTYPPRGKRGIGAERATAWGRATAEHVAEANDHVLVIPLIESVTAAQNIDELLKVEGPEIFLFGPSDFSSTAGYAGQWEGPGVAEQILATKDAIRAAGKYCGLLGTSNANLLEREAQGFRLLGLGFDNGLLLRALTEALGAVGRDTQINAALNPARK